MDFFYKYKTSIFLILFILLSAFLGFILYSIFFNQSAQPGKDGVSKTPSGGFPNAQDGSGQIITPGDEGALPTSTEPSLIPGKTAEPIASGGLTETQVLNNLPSTNVTGSQDGNGLQFYNEYDGKFYSIDKDGKMVALSDRVFYSVQNVAWANTKDKAVIEYPDGANILYDFTAEKSVTLPKHWEEFEFSPDSKQIAAKSIGLDPENRWLTIANVDGSNAQKIEPLGNNADSVYTSWSPNNQSVAMFTEGEGLDRQSLYFIGKNQENFKSTTIEGRGFRPLWAPDGKQLLYSVYSNDNSLKPMLWIVGAQGDTIGQARRSLGVETWADKCVFSSGSNVYCAVPQNLQEGSGLFPDLANNSDDYIYKINVANGTKKLIAIPDKKMTVTNIVVSEDESTLYFTDAYSKSVNKISL